MSLEVRRILKVIEDQKLPDFAKKISDACGKPIKVEIDWAAFTNKEDASYFGNACFDRMSEAITKVCRDDLGKQAVQKFFHTIKVTCVSKDQMKDKMKFEVKDGVFYVAGAWGQSGGYFGAEDYRKYIEKNAD